MSDIKRVPFEASGLNDAVELMASCSVARFKLDKSGRPIGIKGTPRVHPCKIMASYDGGTVSLSVQEVGTMVSVRLDELMAVLHEASAAALENLGERLGKQEEEIHVNEDATAQG